MRYSKLPARRALLVLFILLGLGATASGSVETTELAPAMTLQEAVSRALANNPGIKAAKIDVYIEEARRDANALSTPYKFQTEVENFAGTDNVSGFDFAETTLRLSKVLELGDKRQYRTNVGDAQVGLARIETTVQQLELTAEVSRRYANLLKRQEQIKLAAESVAIGNRTLEVVQRRVAAGRASEAEQSSAAVALSRTELIGQRLEFELAGARVGLSTLWGSTTPAFTRVDGDIFLIPPLPAYAELEKRLAENPELLRFSTISRIQNAQRKLAQSRRRSDIELSAGLRHLATTDDMAMVFSFSMPFGSSGRAEPLVRETDMAIAKMPMTREDRLLNLKSALFSFYQMLLADRSEFYTLHDQIIPEAERAVRFYERGFELGSYSLLELTASQESLLALRRDALEAAATYHLALIEVESLLGSMSPGGALQ